MPAGAAVAEIRSHRKGGRSEPYRKVVQAAIASGVDVGSHVREIR